MSGSFPRKQRNDKPSSEFHQNQGVTISMEPDPSYEIIDHIGARGGNLYEGGKYETEIQDNIYENPDK